MSDPDAWTFTGRIDTRRTLTIRATPDELRRIREAIGRALETGRAEAEGDIGGAGMVFERLAEAEKETKP